MRTEQEMFCLILGVAEKDQRVRAVFLNGSRANPDVKRDRHQDYDIVYVVTETASFLADRGWVAVFGDIAIVQEPDANDFGWGEKVDYSRSYTWLILFKDGTRIDLQIQIKDAALETYLSDTLTVPLLDKDHLLPPIPPSSDRGYRLQKPTKFRYDGSCNEFWWCLNNVAKGIVRRQLPYAMRMYSEIVHTELDKMLEWTIGTETGFTVSTGMWGKYFEKYLPAELYDAYTKTFSAGDYESLWEAIFAACRLFRETAQTVAQRLGFTYNQSDDDAITAYLLQMRGC